MLHDDITFYFTGANFGVRTACRYLEEAIAEYYKSDLDETTKLGRIAALRAKQDYLRGVKFDSSAHPWCEDVDNQA